MTGGTGKKNTYKMIFTATGSRICGCIFYAVIINKEEVDREMENNVK